MSSQKLDVSTQTKSDCGHLEYVNRALLRQIREYEGKLKICEERVTAMQILLSSHQHPGSMAFPKNIHQEAADIVFSFSRKRVSTPTQSLPLVSPVTALKEDEQFGGTEINMGNDVTTIENSQSASTNESPSPVQVTPEPISKVYKSEESNCNISSVKEDKLECVANESLTSNVTNEPSEANFSPSYSDGENIDDVGPDGFVNARTIQVEGLLFPSLRQKLQSTFSKYGKIEKIAIKNFDNPPRFKSYIQFSHEFSASQLKSICGKVAVTAPKKYWGEGHISNSGCIQLLVRRKRAVENLEHSVNSNSSQPPISLKLTPPHSPKTEKKGFQNIQNILFDKANDGENRKSHQNPKLEKTSLHGRDVVSIPRDGFFNARSVHIHGFWIQDPEDAIIQLHCMLSVYGRIQKVAVVRVNAEGQSHAYVQFSSRLSETQLEHINIHMQATCGLATCVEPKIGPMVSGQIKVVKFD